VSWSTTNEASVAEMAENVESADEVEVVVKVNALLQADKRRDAPRAAAEIQTW